MNIKVIGSGSSGNCYRIDDGKTALLIECGLPIKKIKEGCNFSLSSISGCLITHEHGDHSKAVHDAIKAGVNIYTSRGTANALNIIGNYRTHLMSEKSSYRIGSLIVVGFRVHHDAAEPFGYLVESLATHERLLFMTDSYYTEYKFPRLTHIMIEANFAPENIIGDPRHNRLIKSHMSIDNCLKFLSAADLSEIKEIYLIHLSQSNGDAEEFKRRVQETTGCPVYVA